MFSNIVIAWDASARARRAFDCGLELARKFSARVKLVAVATSVEHSGTERDRAASMSAAERFYAERGQELLSAARERGIQVDLAVIPGSHPAQDVVEYARKHGADLIIVGRRGMSTAERFMLGSVSYRIVRYAPCAVLVVGV